MKTPFRAVAALCLATTFVLAPVAASGSDRPVTIVVGGPSGGTTDTLARIVAASMGQTLNRTVIVENKAGAGGNIAAAFVAKAKPDGNTLLISFTSHTINGALYKRLPFDPVKDFTPISMIATVPSVLIARKDVPFNTLPELIRYAKQHPGKLTLAVGAQGSSLHLAGEKFKLMSNVDIRNIPYKGTAPALIDVLGGQADLMFASTVNVVPQLKSGRIKVLGVSSPEPLPQFPGVSPISDTLKGFESSAWFGLFGPAMLPPEASSRLYEAVRKAVQDPAFRALMDRESARPVTMSPNDFTKFVAADVQRWANVIKASGVSVE